jgi:hypothetical protein
MDNIYVELRSGIQELIAGVCKKYRIKTPEDLLDTNDLLDPGQFQDFDLCLRSIARKLSELEGTKVTLIPRTEDLGVDDSPVRTVKIVYTKSPKKS